MERDWREEWHPRLRRVGSATRAAPPRRTGAELRDAITRAPTWSDPGDQRLRRRGRDLPVSSPTTRARRRDAPARSSSTPSSRPPPPRTRRRESTSSALTRRTTSVYAGAVPADVVLACGIFGNITDEDSTTPCDRFPMLCAPGRDGHLDAPSPPARPDRRRPALVRRSGVRGARLRRLRRLPVRRRCPSPYGPPLPFEPGGSLFTFVGYDAVSAYGSRAGSARSPRPDGRRSADGCTPRRRGGPSTSGRGSRSGRRARRARRGCRARKSWPSYTDRDAIRACRRRQAVRDHDDRAARHQPFERGLDLVFRTRVEVRRRLVEHEDASGRPARRAPATRAAALRPTGGAALADSRVEPSGNVWKRSKSPSATRAASTSSSVASGRPTWTLSRRGAREQEPFLRHDDDPARATMEASRCAGRRRRSAPRPRSGRRSAISFASVDLPAPVGPTSATRSPAGSCSDTSCSTGSSPYANVTCSTSISSLGRGSSTAPGRSTIASPSCRGRRRSSAGPRRPTARCCTAG